MASRIPVDPTKEKDPHYRYHMDAIVTKVEGSGNGIKTVIVNAIRVAETLNRKVAYLMKYLAFELAATEKLKDDKHILTGRHERADVQEKVYGFITRYCLCKRCRNPETALYVDQNQHVQMRCSACGVTNAIDVSERLVKVILKNEQPRAQETRRRINRHKNAKTEAEEWDLALGERGASSGFKELENPVDLFRRQVAEFTEASEEPVTDQDIYEIAVNLRTEYALSDMNLVQLVFEGIFTEDILAKKEIATHAKLLHRIVRDDRTRRVLVEEVMAFCERAGKSENPDVASLPKKFPLVLMALYQQGVLTQEFLLEWARQRPRRSFDVRVQLEMRIRAKPLIQYLEQEDEESDEDSDEDSGDDGAAATDSDDEAGEGAASDSDAE